MRLCALYSEVVYLHVWYNGATGEGGPWSGIIHCCDHVDRLPKTDKSSDITQSAVYKMIHGIDQPRPRPRAPPTEG